MRLTNKQTAVVIGSSLAIAAISIGVEFSNSPETFAPSSTTAEVVSISSQK